MSIMLTVEGSYATGAFDESAAEIVAHDPTTQRLFVVNGDSEAIDVLDIGLPSTPSLLFSIDVGAVVPGGSPNSVAVAGGIVAVAVEADATTDPGAVLFYDTDGTLLSQVQVGALPDSLTFTPDGSKLLVANEGEPDGSLDPIGTVSVIDLSGGPAGATVQHVGFAEFDADFADLIADGVRIAPGKSFSQDAEPEYISVAPDGQTAYVTLQESNAVAVIDLSGDEPAVTEIHGLGAKDHSVAGNGLDPSNEDGGANIATHPVFGLYMPDAIATYEVGGETYYVTANEGDARSEDERIGDLALDPTAFPDAATLQQDDVLGRLHVSTNDGDTDGDGDFDQLFAFGARSFSIWDASGNLVFDSGDQFEQIVAATPDIVFNANNDDNDPDARSDDKGPEPEGVAIGEIDGDIYAFVGLERVGGIMVYNVTDPTAPEFVQYINNRDFTADPETAAAGDLGPEGLTFIAAEDSPNGLPMLAVGNEVSGTTTLYSINLVRDPVINEFVFNHTGADTAEFVEVLGTADADLSDLTLVHIEGDGANAGTIDAAFTLGTADADGYVTTGFQSGAFENGTSTLFLVENFTGSVGDDLDTDNDGVLDTTPWDALADAVAVSDGDGGDVTYADTVLTPDFDGGSFTVGGASRIPNGTDTDSAGDWVRNDFDGEGLPGFPGGSTTAGEAFNTPGAENEAVVVPIVAIYDIQGAGHISDYADEEVETAGIVTAVAFNGFYLQDPTGDGDDHTSDGIFVATDGAPTVAVGDEVRVGGTVIEDIPGGAATGNLSTTTLMATGVATLSTGNALPAATAIGLSGRIPPAETVISDDETPVNLQDPADDAANNFDPDEDAIDFYESMEGMRVTIEAPQAVSPTRVFSEFSAEFFTVPNGGDAGIVEPDDALTDRGGISLQPDPDNLGDQNPERVQVQFDETIYGGAPVAVNVGDQLADVTGVLGYSFGNYEVNATAPVLVETPSDNAPEVTTLQGGDDALTVASYNVLNLSPDASDDAQRDILASQIVNNLLSPDIIALQEIQDNSGETDDGTVAADETLQVLVDAIAAAGGPSYSFVTVDPADGTGGGVPGGNIRNAYLYNDDRVDLTDAVSLTPTELTAAGVSDPNVFDGTRDPLVGVFEFNGETVYVVNNHLPSRFGSTPIFGGPQPFEQAGELDREAAAETLNEYVDFLVGSGAENVIVTGDMNTFEFTNDLSEILPGTGADRVLTNLVSEIGPGDEDENDQYTFIFDGNSQVLDHMFVTDGLLDGAEFDIVHVNNDFARDDAGVEFPLTVGSDHEPILGSFQIGEEASSTFSLQILHTSDLEGGLDAIDRAANFAAIVDRLEDEAENSITLSAGDNWIPSPFFNAAGDIAVRDALQSVYQELYGEMGLDNIREGVGRIDVSIMNVIGFDASALGNHEFDFGTDALASIIGPDVRGATLNDVRWLGAQFPYLSANLDFSEDPSLAGLFTADILPNTDFMADLTGLPGSAITPKIAPATILEEGGELIGVVGATTQLLETISSPGDTSVVDPDGVTADDMAELAAILQPVVDDLKAEGVNKIIVVSHLQQIALETELAGLLDGVDVIVAGGSDTRLANPDDDLRPGDTSDGQYPVITTDAAGNPTVIVSTDGEYSYVGQLSVDFDENGILIASDGTPLDDLADLDLSVNGPIATTDANVEELWGEDDPFAEGTKGELVQTLTDAVQEVVNEKDGNILGQTEVFLEGRRAEVRTEETNMGNLSADANLALARSYDSSVLVSIKNGGGIRAPIGEVDGTTGALLPPGANPDAGKEEGDISQLDVENSLRFNNSLALVTVTAAQLLAVVEHAFAATADGNTPGQFPQIGGMEVSFDPNLPAGDRVQSLAIADGDGNVVDIIAAGGELVGDAEREIRMVTLGFLADGGDGYPFEDATDRVDLNEILTDAGLADFAAPGTEQDALAEFLLAFHNEDLGGEAYDDAETAPDEDERIQNLDVRDDTVLDGVGPGTDGDDVITGGVGDDVIFALGGDDTVDGGRGDDTIAGGAGHDTIFGDRGGDILSGDAGNDTIRGGRGDDAMDGGTGDDDLFGGRGDDMMNGGEGDDLLSGGRGDDVLHGDAGDDVLRGGRGDDELAGGAGDDVLRGGRGDDEMTGGEGDDVSVGGQGSDIFIFAQGDGSDIIRDFELGIDLIDVADFGFTSFGDIALEQVGTDRTVARFDTASGDEVLLIGVNPEDLSQSDFVLA